jgi:hypothetical protein
MAGTGYSLGDFTAEREAEHVLIHARVDAKGGFTLLDGSPLPALHPGARVQLRVRAADLHDKQQRNALTSWESRQLLPAEQVVLALVDTRALQDPAQRQRLEQEGLLPVMHEALARARGLAERQPRGWHAHAGGPGPKAHEGLLEVRLLEPLEMERRGLKTYRLRPCACEVTALAALGTDAPRDYSLNHALTRISERLELNRISHTGNAFTRFLVELPQGDGLQVCRLADLRDAVSP